MIAFAETTAADDLILLGTMAVVFLFCWILANALPKGSDNDA